jgi:hypothetical protein
MIFLPAEMKINKNVGMIKIARALNKRREAQRGKENIPHNVLNAYS